MGVRMSKDGVVRHRRSYKKISCVTNVQNNENINGKLKFILPLFFIFGFILVRFSLGFYNKQKRLSELNQ